MQGRSLHEKYFVSTIDIRGQTALLVKTSDSRIKILYGVFT